MLSPKGDKFIEDILSYVKFSFDRFAIKTELESHLLDKIEDYTEAGQAEDAEESAITDMGDAQEIGLELNKQHNPLVGWIWMLTRLAVVLLVIVDLFFVGLPIVTSLLDDNPIEDISKANIVYNITVNKTVHLDDTVINFRNVIYEGNGNLNIIYDYYETQFWGTGWSLGGIGIISDNLGNEYFAGSGGGIRPIVRRTVENFSDEADTLIIDYDQYNRKYRVEIPLKGGIKNE
ncbi:permease prefix domain 1-containing protein [Desulfosporosinus shakirovi]|uniref:permease prefix domain 1-containing protein n=1 Tax=Desulfosporosinus shakirovi TaxID=2885154 RepID=UPI001E4C8FB1|nr:permease prefix domain 1-containing protein [Desulfosporosinus sp. SRJS8]MCB8814615.1 permease prefix domain 1-containing protein [Desulfosporosinus sp. SRJS8]